jgi:transposase-like protein
VNDGRPQYLSYSRLEDMRGIKMHSETIHGTVDSTSPVLKEKVFLL